MGTLLKTGFIRRKKWFNPMASMNSFATEQKEKEKKEPAEKVLWVMAVAEKNNTIGFYAAETYTKGEARAKVKKHLGLKRLPPKTIIRRGNDFGIKGVKIRMVD